MNTAGVLKIISRAGTARAVYGVAGDRTLPPDAGNAARAKLLSLAPTVVVRDPHRQAMRTIQAWKAAGVGPGEILASMAIPDAAAGWDDVYDALMRVMGQ